MYLIATNILPLTFLHHQTNERLQQNLQRYALRALRCIEIGFHVDSFLHTYYIHTDICSAWRGTEEYLRKCFHLTSLKLSLMWATTPVTSQHIPN